MITTAAIISIVALVILVIISMVKEDLNVGFLGIGFAIIVGSIFVTVDKKGADGKVIKDILTGDKVMGLLDVKLFMILVGVTFLFALAQSNGTMEKFTAYSVRLCKGNTVLIPLIVFILTTVIATIGPGNIAACALMAPVAMAIAGRIKLPAFIMTLIVVGAANGAAFSPVAPTGIISNGLIAKMAPILAKGGLGNLGDLNALGWKIYFNSAITQGIVTILGFSFMGGIKWVKEQRGSNISIDELVPKPQPFNSKQIITISAIAALILLVVLPGIPALKAAIPANYLGLVANVGSVAFILAAILMLVGAGDSKSAIKVMPWNVIMMVSGVSILISVMEQAGGLSALTKVIGSMSNPVTVNGWLGLITGVISAYSSSSGVVVPMFLPMVPGLIKEIGGGNPIALISSINVGAHLVDTSPLSTLGALCIACAADGEDKAKLFRKLLIWGLSMSVVAAVICLLFFGVLNL